MKRPNWCFIGTGMIAQSVLRDDPEINVVSVASGKYDNARALAERLGAKAYQNPEEAVCDPNVDIVYIATPHPLHLSGALAAIAAGRAVLCEKPITVNSSELSVMVDAARTKRVFLAEAMWPRFNPVVRTVRDWVASGLVGDIRHISADYLRFAGMHWRRLYDPALAGGCTLDLGVYPLAFIQSLLGAPTKLSVSGAKNDEGVDIRAAALLTYKGGATAYALSGFDSTAKAEVIISGSKGTITVPDAYWTRRATLEINGGAKIEITRDEEPNGYHHQMRTVEGHVRRGMLEAPEITLRDSQEVIAMCDTIRAALGVKYPFEN